MTIPIWFAPSRVFKNLYMDKSIHSAQYTSFLTLLKTARIERNITQVQLAERLQETQVFVSKCERGERRLDIIETMRWCQALGISLAELAQQLENC